MTRIIPTTIIGRFASLLIVFGLATTSLVGFQLYSLHGVITDAEKDSIQNVTDAAHASVQRFYDLATAGEITMDEAKAMSAHMLRAMRYNNGRGHFTVRDETYNRVVHGKKPKKEGVGANEWQSELDIHGEPYVKAYMEKAFREGGGFVSYTRVEDGITETKNKYTKLFAPWNWVIQGSVYDDQIQEDFWNAAQTDIIITVMFLGGLLAVGFLVLRSISGPLRETTGNILSLANGDLSITPSGVDRTDEIGQISRAVQGFKENALEQNRLQAVSAEEQKAREVRQQTVERLIGEFEPSIADMMASVGANTNKMREAAVLLTEVAGQTEAKAGEASTASERATQNVQTVASAAEELSASISEINRQVDQSTQVVQKASKAADAANSQVAGLSEGAQKIGEVVTLIQAIAEQTNLLALNATIEAARAGEAGKGFAVVAAEVKELANQTSKATEEIGAQISAIQSATDGAVGAIEQIGATMQEVNSYTYAIAEAVTQQGQATEEISMNVQDAATGTAAASGSMSDVKSAATDTNTSASVVMSSTNEVGQNAEALRQRISTFLKDVAAA